MKKEKKKPLKLEIQVNLKKTENYHFVPQLTNVFFPFQPYPQQISIVRTIQEAIKHKQNALIESPTGTGKTICLLIGSLSSLIDEDCKKKIYYLTRTHSQISQVINQFKRTVYQCNLNVIASRQQFCLNHNLSQLKGKQLQKACDELCMQKLCTFKEHSYNKIPKPMEVHEFRDLCKKQLVCPYFYSKQLTEKCEITILPFNYLLDWNLFQKNSIDLKDSIIIFDQAHNIDSLCEQGSDIRLTSDILNQALAEIKQLIKLQSKKYLHRQFKEPFDQSKQVGEAKEIFQLLLSGIKNSQELQFVSRQIFAQKIQEFTTTGNTDGLDLGNYSTFLFKMKKVIKLFHKKELSCDNTQIVTDVLQKIYTTASNIDQFRKFTVNLIKGQLLFRCLDPSLCFKRLIDCKPRSILLSSGTLGNLDIWQKNLQVAFPYKITTESFITTNHLYAQVRAKSENGIPFNFTFQGKQSEQQFKEICKQLKKISQFVSGGIIVAFSNYDLLQKTLKFASIVNKKIYFQTKGGNIDDIFKQYSAQAQNSTALLFIIMKGRFSEGINFAGKLCRCLIIVGIPFLPLKDSGIMQKMKYIQINCSKDDADLWYTQQSFRSLNQTIGRAIRNTDDYAAIILLDQRYQQDQKLKHLSKWFVSCLRSAKNTYQDVADFLKNAATVEHKTLPKDNQSSTKNNKSKNQANICERLLEFSTPSKTDRKKMKLKFDNKIEEATPLKEIKIEENEQPGYHYMNQQLANFFMDSFTKPTCSTSSKLEVQYEEEEVEQSLIKKINKQLGVEDSQIDF